MRELKLHGNAQLANCIVLGPDRPKTIFLSQKSQFLNLRGRQVGIDAIIKIPERFTDYAPVSQADPDEVRDIAEKLAAALR